MTCSPGGACFRSIAAGLFLLLVAAAPAHAAEKDGADFARRFDYMKKVFVLARSAAREIPTATFEPDTVLAETGSSYQAIFDWVAKETTWVPYRGALRGPRGVLMDRVGSHLDRALLLAELLERSGQEVRIERGELSAEALVAWLSAQNEAESPSSPVEPEVEEAALAARLGEVARILGTPLEEVRRTYERSRIRNERLLEDLAHQTALTTPRLAQAFGLEPDGKGAALDPALAAIGADHFRVAIHRGNQWIPLDPLVGPGKSGESLFEAVAESFLPGEVPEDLRHRLTIRVVAERWSKGSLERSTALEQSMDATALLTETPSLTLLPLDWPRDLPKVTLDARQMKELAAKTEQAFLEQTEWLPMLELEHETVRQKSFLASGRIVDQPSITLESRKVRSANDALSGLGGRDDQDSELTAVFVVVEIRAPGEQPLVAERTWFDLLGPARRAAGVAKLALSKEERQARAIGLGGAMNLLALPARPSEAWLAHQRLGALLRNRVPVLGALYAAMRDEGDSVSKYLDRGRPSPVELYSLSGNRFAGPTSSDVCVDGLNVVASFSHPVLADGKLGLAQGLDLVRVSTGVLPGSGRSARRARFAQGVADTVAEALTLPRTLGKRTNAAESFMRALAAGVDWVRLEDPGVVDAAPIALGPDARERVRRALLAGRVVLAPPTGGDPSVWWEHDPKTGAVLGMTAGGHGGATEEIVLIANDAFSLIMTMKGVLSCRGKEDLQMACCLLQNAAFGGYGLGVGMSFGKAGLDLWGVAFNVAYSAATNEINLCGD